MDQVLLGSHDIVIVFKLCDILAFFATTVQALLLPSSSLAKVLTAGKDIAWKRFFDILTAQSSHLLQAAGPFPSDLKSSRYLVDALARLVLLLCGALLGIAGCIVAADFAD